MKSKLLRILALTPALAIALALPAHAQEAPARVEGALAEVKGDAAKAGLKELDTEIDRLDALLDHAPTADEKAAAKARLAVLKERRSELRKTYVGARYDELKADVRAESARLSAWTKSKFNRDPASGQLTYRGCITDSTLASKNSTTAPTSCPAGLTATPPSAG